jgi:phosphoribosylformylglycinamidine synthase
MWQFSQAIEGISLACEALEIPVVSGNVSLYNETDGKPIYPSPMVGVVGVKEGKLNLRPSFFNSTQLEIGLVGPLEGGLGGSLLASQWFQRDCGQPEKTDLKLLKRTINFLEVIYSKRFQFCGHDVADGGLLLSVLEMAFSSPFPDIGIEIRIPQAVDVDGFLFGETIPRVILAYDSTESTEVERFAQQAGVPFMAIGSVNDSGLFQAKQGGAIILKQEINLLKKSWCERWKKIFT